MSTTQIAPPYPVFTDVDGTPLDDGYLYIGEANKNPETASVPVYWDSALTQPVAQPIRTNNGYPWRNGTPAMLYAATNNFSVTVRNKKRELVIYAPVGFGTQSKVVSVTDFGAKGDGVTDDTQAIRNAIASLPSGGEVLFPNPDVSYLITDTVNITTGNITLTGTGNDCNIQMIDGSFTGLQVTGVSGVTIRGFKFSCKNQANLASYKAAVMFYNSNYCYMDKLSAFYMGFWGFALWNANGCSITNCSTGDWWGNQQDSANIVVFKQSSFNLIQGNVCGGTGADHGIFVQDPYAGDKPTGNIIDSNRVIGTHKAYGIVIYVTTVYDTKHIVTNNYVEGVLGTQLVNNYVEGVLGTQLVNNASGAGIYLQSASGTVCANNEVYNCCQQTINFSTLNIAHITATTGDEYTYPGAYMFTPIIIANNKVRAVRGPGIWAGTSYAAVVIDGNAVVTESTDASFSEAIKVTYCNNAKVSNNTVIHAASTGTAIQATAIDQYDIHTGLSQANLQITDNFVKTVGYGIMINTTTSGSWYDVTVANNIVQTTGPVAYFLEKINRCSFSGNQCTTDQQQLYITNCTYVRGSDNILYTNSVSGGYTINLVGTCTGSHFDKTNRYNGVMNNGAAGFLLEFLHNTYAPMSGTFGVGDRIINSEPSLGEAAGWQCIAAGNPGTWSPIGQCGYRTGSAAPSVNAYFVGEEFLDTTNNKWYKSKTTGTGASDWVALN